MTSKFVFVVLFVYQFSVGQIGQPEVKYEMDLSVQETSGLLFYHNKIVTINDSGNLPKLYEMDTISNTITRTISVANATNHDWESLAQDANYIYIGDFGNNQGDRTDLKIYKILKTEYNTNTSVFPEVISFHYQDQTDFTTNNQTNFDAEAMLSKGDSLYVFTKNHGDLQTRVYALPKTSGAYQAQLICTYNTACMITGATYNSNENQVYLTAYDANLYPFIFYLSDFSGNNFFEGTVQKTAILSQGNQVEAITGISNNRYFISRERLVFGSYNFPQQLFAFTANYVSKANEIPINLIQVYPNPSQGDLWVQTKNIEDIQLVISNATGQIVQQYQSTGKQLQVNLPTKGLYFFTFVSATKAFVQKVIIY